jgi:hypothetical protein
MDVVRKIGSTKVGAQDRPVKDGRHSVGEDP